MIDPAVLNAHPAHNTAPENQARPRLHMRRDPDDRTAGSIPVWQSPARDNSKIQEPGSFDQVMDSYADIEPAAGNVTETDAGEEFTFGDLIDIVNPLHHIPLVSTVYQSVTGDTIKPAGRIIGGAVFGGFVGAASGIANVIIEEETGKDVAGNVVAFVTQGDLPQTKIESLSPEEQLDRAAQLAFNDVVEREELPEMALALQSPSSYKAAPQADKSTEVPAAVTEYEHYLYDDDRTAGTMPGAEKTAQRRAAMQLPLPQHTLVDPVSINLASIRASQMAAITQLELSPIDQE